MPSQVNHFAAFKPAPSSGFSSSMGFRGSQPTISVENSLVDQKMKQKAEEERKKQEEEQRQAAMAVQNGSSSTQRKQTTIEKFHSRYEVAEIDDKSIHNFFNEVTSDDRIAFQAPQFALHKIPEVAPPAEFCQ